MTTMLNRGFIIVALLAGVGCTGDDRKLSPRKLETAQSPATPDAPPLKENSLGETKRETAPPGDVTAAVKVVPPAPRPIVITEQSTAASRGERPQLVITEQSAAATATP